MKRPSDRWVIEPRGAGLGAKLAEAWRGRALLTFFARRAADAIVTNTLLGFAWLILRPAIPVAIMVFVFGVLMQVRFEGGAPYLIHFILGMTAFSAFDAPLTWATRGLYMNRGLLSKMYFPRILVPLGSTFPGLVELFVLFLFAMGALALTLALSGRLYIVFGPGLLLALAALSVSFLLALGLSLFTSLWDFQARDTRYTLSVVLRFLLYLTPVIYPASAIPSEYRVYFFLNPLAGVVECFRLGVLGQVADAPVTALIYAAAVAAILLLAGVIHFNAAESTVIDRA